MNLTAYKILEDIRQKAIFAENNEAFAEAIENQKFTVPEVKDGHFFESEVI